MCCYLCVVFVVVVVVAVVVDALEMRDGKLPVVDKCGRC